MTPRKEILKSFTQMLPCDLTDEQQKDRGVQLAHAEGDLEAFLLEAKAERAAIRDKKKEKELLVHNLAETVRTKKEEREVECYLRASKRDGWVDVFRTDTKEIVTSRKSSDDENQVTIPFNVPDESDLAAS